MPEIPVFDSCWPSEQILAFSQILSNNFFAISIFVDMLCFKHVFLTFVFERNTKFACKILVRAQAGFNLKLFPDVDIEQLSECCQAMRPRCNTNVACFVISIQMIMIQIFIFGVHSMHGQYKRPGDSSRRTSFVDNTGSSPSDPLLWETPLLFFLYLVCGIKLFLYLVSDIRLENESNKTVL